MKKTLHRTLIFAASCGALTSGLFWLLSAQAQMGAMEPVASSKIEVLQSFLQLSAEMNYWAAISALFAGAALVLSALFEESA